MKIKDIKDPKVQQMAVVEAIKHNPKNTLKNILKLNLIAAFNWGKSPQGSFFWDKVLFEKTPKYTDKDLWYKDTSGSQIIQCETHNYKSSLVEQWIRLATPEEVYKHLKQKDMTNPTYGKNTIYKQEEPEVQKDASTLHKPMCNDWETYAIQLEQDVKDLKFKIANLEANKDWLSSQNEKLNKLVDEIESNCEDQTNPRMKLNAIHRLIYLHRNPSLVGTTHTVEIDGKKYEVQVIKKI